ncbi:MAG TPA: DsbA family protein [Burkholderiales bacterium]
MPTPHKIELAIPVSPIDHLRGADHAPITLVEYGDFECPSCKQVEQLVELMMMRFPNHLRVVFRHYPLEGVHTHALLAAQAAEAAAAQGRFWDMHDLLFAHQQHLKLAQLRGYAEQLELDMTRFSAEMGDEVYLQRVREQIEGGKKSGVRATPTLYLNGVIQDTSFGLEALEKAVAGLAGN